VSKLNIDVTIDVWSVEGPSETVVSEAMHLELPSLASKYIQFPKIFEGVIEQAVERHNNRMTAWEVRRAKEEAERRARPMLWEDYPTEAEPLPAPSTEEVAAVFNGVMAEDAPVLDGQLLLDATLGQIDDAVAEAVAQLEAEVSDVEPS
jgi:hypothetical protein